VTEADIDRLGELANIGAGHAATAFSRLAGRPIWMEVPRVRTGDDVVDLDDELADWSTGVFFEFGGYLSALVGILFEGPASEALVRTVVGEENEDLSPHAIESALMEIGNILASHVASAIADTVGVRLLPSIPTLAMQSAEAEFNAMIENRPGEHPLRIDCELRDLSGTLGGRLVLIPDLIERAEDVAAADR
jgi:chemotaxis protein CheC